MIATTEGEGGVGDGHGGVKRERKEVPSCDIIRKRIVDTAEEAFRRAESERVNERMSGGERDVDEGGGREEWRIRLNERKRK